MLYMTSLASTPTFDGLHIRFAQIGLTCYGGYLNIYNSQAHYSICQLSHMVPPINSVYGKPSQQFHLAKRALMASLHIKLALDQEQSQMLAALII